MQRILKEYALQFPQNIKQLLFHIDNNTLTNDISQFYSLCILTKQMQPWWDLFQNILPIPNFWKVQYIKISIY